MGIQFKMHEAGCTPFDRCKVCVTVDALRSSLSAEMMEALKVQLEGHGFDPDNHLPDCTPAAPCHNCSTCQLMQAALGSEFEKFLRSVSHGTPLELSSQLIGPGQQEALVKKIDDLDLRVRHANALHNYDIRTLAQLCSHTETELLRLPNFGKIGLKEVKQALQLLGLTLGMQIPAGYLK